MRFCLVITLILGLGGCAATPADQAPSCNGARTTANPHGSVFQVDGAPVAALLQSQTPSRCQGARR